MILFFYKIADTITSTIFGIYLNSYNFSTHNRHHLWTKLHFSHTCAAATSYDMQKWHLAFLLPWSFLTQLLGHRALLIFPLAAMLTFCQIIRKLDLIFFLTQSLQSCHWYADEISPKKAYFRLFKMHACVLPLNIDQTEHTFLHPQGHVKKNG